MTRLPETPLFETPTFDPRRDVGQFDAETAAFVVAMHRDGGAVIDLGEAARALCNQAVAETEPMFAKGARVQDAWRRSPAVRRLATLPVIHQHLGAAYGRRSFVFQTLNFRVGSQQELHSDVIHFSSKPAGFMCGVWIALEDIEAGSGPLTWFPGSHRLPPLSMREAGVNGRGDGAAYAQVWAPRFAERIAASGIAAQALLIPKGTAFVWAANLAHGGEPIMLPGSTRRSLVVHCYFEDSYYFTPMVSDVEAGVLATRIPPDVGRGFWRWPRLDGKLAPVRVKTVIAAVLRALTNRPSIT